VALHGAGNFNIAAVARGDEVGTDQQQNDLGGVEAVFDVTIPLVTGEYFAIVPVGNITVPLEDFQMVGQLIPQRFILVRIGKKDSNSVGCHEEAQNRGVALCQS
jgi:hypothetical protein